MKRRSMRVSTSQIWRHSSRVGAMMMAWVPSARLRCGSWACRTNATITGLLD